MKYGAQFLVAHRMSIGAALVVAICRPTSHAWRFPNDPRLRS